MWALISTVVNWLLSLIFPARKGPSVEQLAASNATAQTELAQSENANADLSQADSARIVDDVAVMHNLVKPSVVDSTINAAIAKQFPNAVSTD